MTTTSRRRRPTRRRPPSDSNSASSSNSASALASRGAVPGDWWKHSPSEPGECDKHLHGGCKGDVHERRCTEDGCAYAARRCEAHGGKKGTGQQLGAHTGRHRAERRQLEQEAATEGADAR